ncbi:hypothetical protein LY78DRAFT_674517 [Colletotrichum sublineola]|nr:hypothetical protein LY78DRAFT_674517 [Colletotrichum sublineola]
MGNFQGLRTASFWLSYMAWSVSGLTIRRAMEFQLGKAFDFVVGASAIEKVSPHRFQLGSREEAKECFQQGFDRQLDQWMMAWTGQYRSHERTGNFLLKALTLHYHFAKLFVSSHVFRGRSSHGGGEPVPPEYSDIAQVAAHEELESSLGIFIEPANAWDAARGDAGGLPAGSRANR